MPRASCLVPRALCFVPRALCLVPRASCPVPVAHGSWLVARVSWPVARGSCLMPRAPCPVPRASCPVARGSWLVVCGSWLGRCCLAVNLWVGCAACCWACFRHCSFRRVGHVYLRGQAGSCLGLEQVSVEGGNLWLSVVESATPPSFVGLRIDGFIRKQQRGETDAK